MAAMVGLEEKGEDAAAEAEDDAAADSPGPAGLSCSDDLTRWNGFLHLTTFLFLSAASCSASSSSPPSSPLTSVRCIWNGTNARSGRRPSVSRVWRVTPAGM
jgi:hypothetical protein